MEKPEIKSITIYVYSGDIEPFLSGDYTLVWWEEFRRSNNFIEVAVSLYTYCNLTDIREQQDLVKNTKNLDLPF